MRIGLFGGTFNPVHMGHLRAAVEVKEGFQLNKIYIIPAALPPHKMPGEVAKVEEGLWKVDGEWLDGTVTDLELQDFPRVATAKVSGATVTVEVEAYDIDRTIVRVQAKHHLKSDGEVAHQVLNRILSHLE